jgi:uncharacterized membrane protein
MIELLNTVFVIFFASAVLGWVFEVVYCTIVDWKKRQRIAYRGFLLGPYCPIYGFFAVLFLPFLTILDLHPVAVYVVIVAFATLLEFVVAVVLERIFKLKWWDYTEMYRVQYKGRIALAPSLFWGAIGAGFYYFLYPMMLTMANEVFARFGGWLALSLAVLMAVDAATTVVRLRNFKRFVHKLHKSDKAKEIDADKYVAFVVSSIKNNFIPSIKRFVARTIPHPDVSFLKLEIWTKRGRRKKPRE